MLSGQLVSLEWLSDQASVPTLLALILHTFIDCSFSVEEEKKKSKEHCGLSFLTGTPP